MKRGFTLIEMLIVVTIIAVLTMAGIHTFKGATAKADDARCQELVHNAATALSVLFQQEKRWPAEILNNPGHGLFDATTVKGAFIRKSGDTYKSKYFSLNCNEKTGEPAGYDALGIVSPWASAVIKRVSVGGTATDSKNVPSGGTIRDHIIRFAVDDDEDGIVSVNYEGTGVLNIRATSAAWCCGRDGQFGTKDDIRSWAKGQVVR